MNFVDAFCEAAEKIGLEFETSQIEAYRLYQELLIEWNQKVNLTAITQPDEIAIKHMIDSILCYDPNVFPAECSVIDVGTGAGFPGLPLKIFRPDLKLTLLDSLNKRLVFLQEVVNRLALKDVILVHSRAEDGARKKEHRDIYQVAVSRAVARLNVLSELCLPYVKPGGSFIALKGLHYQEEVAGAKTAITCLGGEIGQIKPVKLPGLDDGRAIIYITKIKATPKNFPRRPGVPEKIPL
ncbi:MAG: rsmG [Firmicutes bacterium]|nr:rsmG [Bacillota bacterium]